MTSSREDLAKDDTAAFRVLEDIGLLIAEATQRPACSIFRIIGKLPGTYVGYDGVRNEKNRWSFEILCDLAYPRSRPRVRVANGADVPANGFFRSGHFMPVYVNVIRFSGSPVKWQPPADMRSNIKRPADCALAFLYTVNPEELTRRMGKHVSSFQREPLASHEIVRYLLRHLQLDRQDEPKETAASEAADLTPTREIDLRATDLATPPSDSERTAPEAVTRTPSPVPRVRARAPVARKKFEIRAAKEPENVLTSDLPERRKLKVLIEPTSARAGQMLFCTKAAIDQLFYHIAWGHKTVDNVHEQGGVLIGSRYRTPTTAEEFVVVTNALPVDSDSQSATYVKFDHAGWSKVLDELDRLKDNGALEPAASVVGWYHTHPNYLDCFMSGTDRATQRSTFYRSWNYSLVLNPQREQMACFVGPDCTPCGMARLE